MVSIPKLIVLILVGFAVWYVYGIIKRRGVDGIFRKPGPDRAARSAGPKALDMEKCRICGDFVPADALADHEAGHRQR